MDEATGEMIVSTYSIDSPFVTVEVGREQEEKKQSFFAGVYDKCVGFIKDNPYPIAAVLVPIALTALNQAAGAPVPHESFVAASSGGSIAGYGFQAERHTGVVGRAVGAVAGATIGLVAATSAEKILDSTNGYVGTGVGVLDDGAAAIAAPATKGFKNSLVSVREALSSFRK